ncbi:MAG: hypothetical protein KA191_08195 [Verrucomicrobia bacterium]|nr:hypothetical protein [Verrucomicrobiota bacterium]
MTTGDLPCNERVVELVETCDGTVMRTFYCIYDPDFDHWVSEEPFDGLIWTKDPHCRREFDSREEAEEELEDFLEWREDRKAQAEDVAETASDREAA